MTMDREELAEYQERYDNAVIPQTIGRRHFKRMTSPRWAWVDAIIWAVVLVVAGMFIFTIFQF